MSMDHLSPSSHRIRILVVDDNPGTAITLARAIARLSPNLEVLSATDGHMALDQVKGETVDVLITDMMMPDMNGLELIEKLRSNPGGRPRYIILITAYDVLGLKESARHLKVNETLIKPIHPERICQIVGKALEELQPSQADEDSQEAAPKFKLLVADDNPSNVALLVRYLQTENYNLITAGNGVETLAKTRAEMPDLLLLDVNMPDKDGFQVLQEIRADPATEHLPVIILTAARLDPVDMQFALNLGADDYVTKPFDRRELLARIRTKLRVKEAEDAIRRRNKELSLLPEIGKDLSARLDINELTNIVLQRTVETLGALVGHLIILNAPTQFQRQYHLTSMTSSEFDDQLPPMDQALEQIRTSRQGIIINDTNDSPYWTPTPGAASQSVILVPLLGRLELIGLLVLTHEKPNYFSLEHQLLLQAIASQAAIAVENAQLYASMAREQQRMAAVLQGMGDAVLMFDARGDLALLNPAAEKLFEGRGLKLGRPLARNEVLTEFVDEALASQQSLSKEITWPDQRRFAAQATLIGEEGCVVLLHLL